MNADDREFHVIPLTPAEKRKRKADPELQENEYDRRFEEVKRKACLSDFGNCNGEEPIKFTDRKGRK